MKAELTELLARKEEERDGLLQKHRIELEPLERDIAAINRALELLDENSSSKKAEPAKAQSVREQMKQREFAVIKYLKVHGESHYKDIAKYLGIKESSLSDWLLEFIKREGEKCPWITRPDNKSLFRLKLA